MVGARVSLPGPLPTGLSGTESHSMEPQDSLQVIPAPSGFGHLMRRVDSLEKTLMLGGIGGRRRMPVISGRSKGASEKSGILCSLEGSLGTPLGSVQWKRASSRSQGPDKETRTPAKRQWLRVAVVGDSCLTLHCVRNQLLNNSKAQGGNH